MDRFKERLELLANVSIILLGLALSAILLKGHFLPSAADGNMPATPKRVSPGDKLSLNDVNFAKVQKTLLLALAKGCHFCSESAPFYRKLVEETARDEHMQIYFLFPHAADEGRQYLNDLGVHASNIQQTAFATLQVGGTPTLILADNRGGVTDVWVGKLKPSQEEEVLAKLKPCRDCD